MKWSASLLCGFAAGPHPFVKSLTMMCVGGGPEGTETFGGLERESAIGLAASAPGGSLGAGSGVSAIVLELVTLESWVATVEPLPPHAESANTELMAAISTKGFTQRFYATLAVFGRLA